MVMTLSFSEQEKLHAKVEKLWADNLASDSKLESIRIIYNDQEEIATGKYI